MLNSDQVLQSSFAIKTLKILKNKDFTASLSNLTL
ncbi:hypothetical protein RLOC_00005859 [Lonchura striata]|uniref:Uncharacterized protein n=1 Tax=Lonchura striata TaxID=40157 RepID=A0A218UGT7_9PASE|nr:hypothetical protein RLOC_00005859 [Lonchura striata domestica]